MAEIIHFDEARRRVDKDAKDIRPVVPAFNFPVAFERYKDEKRWCSWAWMLSNKGHWTKPPMRAFSEEWAHSDDPSTWDTLEQVRVRVQAQPGARGLGLMLSGLQWLAVIDLDKCVDENGVVADWAQEIVDECGSYAEVSPSRTGIKIFGFVKGRETFSGKFKRGDGEIELFLNTNRYVCITGERIGTAEYFTEVSDTFDRLVGPDRNSRKVDVSFDDDYQDILVDKEREYFRKVLKKIDHNDRAEWIMVGQGLRWYGDAGRELWDEFSKRSDKYDPVDQEGTWRALKPHSQKMGTVIFRAKENGFVDVKDPDEDVELPRQFNVSDEVENQPKEYVINDFIRTGTFAFAGQPGGGKSTILASLATVVSGLMINPDETLKTHIKRRVLWFAEAPEQITDILKVMRENGLLEPDQAVVRDMIKVYYSRRAGPEFWDKALPVLLKDTEFSNEVEGGAYDARPLIVFDTTSANFEIESENDNSEVSRLIANVRRVLRGYPVWLIAHTAKAGRDVSVFDLDARGASAWKGDVEGTAAIGREVADGLRDYRFLRFQKRRYSARYDWIIAERQTFETQHHVIGAVGGLETSYVDTVKIRLVAESEGIEFVEAAREAVAERALEAREAAVLNALQEAANDTRAEGFEGLVVRIQSGRQPEGPIEGYEKLKKVNMEQLRSMARITSGKSEVKEWFKGVIGRLFEVNGDIDVPGCIVAVRAQNFEMGGN